MDTNAVFDIKKLPNVSDMNEFKPGDRVVAIKSVSSCYYEGECFTVLFYTHNHLTVKNERGYTNIFMTSSFRLADPEKSSHLPDFL